MTVTDWIDHPTVTGDRDTDRLVPYPPPGGAGFKVWGYLVCIYTYDTRDTRKTADA